jgi:hypothetical protein
MSHLNWDFVVYIDLADPGYKYQAIMSQYEATAKICEQMTQNNLYSYLQGQHCPTWMKLKTVTITCYCPLEIRTQEKLGYDED